MRRVPRVRRPTLVGAVVVLIVIASGCSKTDESVSATTAALESATPGGLATGRVAIRTPTPNQNPAEADTPVSVTASAAPDSGNAPLTVQLSAVIEGRRTGLRYRWDFGDGTPAGHQLKVQHIYEKAGEYTATFQVSGAGVEESSTASVTVTATSFDLQIDADPDIGHAPLTTHFSAVFEQDLPAPVSIRWDFGDGGQDNNNPTQHTYETAGTYTATLTVTDGQGRHAVHDVEITVDPAAEADGAD